MKSTFKIITLVLFFVCQCLYSCEDFLDEDVYTQYDPDEFLQTEEGLNSLLVSSYSYVQSTGNNQRERLWTLSEFPGDLMWDFGGGFEAIASTYMNFNWTSQATELRNIWRDYYSGIRNTNGLLDNISSNTTLNPERLDALKAEAIFLRAAAYYYLWEFFGPVPLMTTTENVNLEPFRATDDEFNSFLTSELSIAIDNLPIKQDQWGKATKGAALSLLTRYYLNSKQWQNAAETAQEVIDLGEYELFSGDLANMFAVENEVNSEVIFTGPALATFHGNLYMPHAFPPSYPTTKVNFATQFVMYDEFIQTYDLSDHRLGWMLFEYTGTDGVFYDLRLSDSFGIRCFKYQPDPDAIANMHGNDIPMLRYAEVLLNRAEALNELNGLNQESVDLVNQIRVRAGINAYAINDFSSKEEFRDVLLQERSWEFVAEGLRRMDLVRHNKLIEFAIARGVTHAQEYMTRYPIPEVEINSNPNLEQNPGY